MEQRAHRVSQAVDGQKVPSPLVPHRPGVEPHIDSTASFPPIELLDRGAEGGRDLGRGLGVAERDGKRRCDNRVPALGEQRQQEAVPEGRGGSGKGAADEVDDAFGRAGAWWGQEDGAAGGLCMVWF